MSEAEPERPVAGFEPLSAYLRLLAWRYAGSVPGAAFEERDEGVGRAVGERGDSVLQAATTERRERATAG